MRQQKQDEASTQLAQMTLAVVAEKKHTMDEFQKLLEVCPPFSPLFLSTRRHLVIPRSSPINLPQCNHFRRTITTGTYCTMTR